MVKHNEWVFQEREGRLDSCGVEICPDDVGRREAAVRTDEDVLAVPIDDRYETEHTSSGFPEESESGLFQLSRFSSDRHIGFIKVLQHSEDITDRCPVPFSGLSNTIGKVSALRARKVGPIGQNASATM